jgi:hypothetical protein
LRVRLQAKMTRSGNGRGIEGTVNSKCCRRRPLLSGRTISVANLSTSIGGLANTALRTGNRAETRRRGAVLRRVIG